MIKKFIQFYLFIIYWTIVDYHICAFIICARQNKESEKSLFNTNKTQIQGHTLYVNQRDDMPAKTRN